MVKGILQEQLLEPALANQIGTIAGRYSKTANTAGHLSRMVRLFSSAEQGMAELWKATGQVQYAVRALDADHSVYSESDPAGGPCWL